MQITTIGMNDTRPTPSSPEELSERSPLNTKQSRMVFLNTLLSDIEALARKQEDGSAGDTAAPTAQESATPSGGGSTAIIGTTNAIDLALHFLAKEDFRTAESILQEITPEDPPDSKIRQMLIITHIRRQDIATGIEKLERLEKAEALINSLPPQHRLTPKAYLLQEKVEFTTNEEEMKNAIGHAIAAAKELAAAAPRSGSAPKARAHLLISQLYTSMCEIEKDGNQLAKHMQLSIESCHTGLKEAANRDDEARLWNQVIYTLHFYSKLAPSDAEKAELLTVIEKKMQQFIPNRIDDPYIYHNMASILFEKGKYVTNDTERLYLNSKALQMLKHKSEILSKKNPALEDISGLALRGKMMQQKAELTESVYEKIHHHQEAIDLFKRAISYGGRPDCYSGMADSYLALADIESDPYKKRTHIEKGIEISQNGIEKGGIVFPIYTSLYTAYSKLLKLLPSEEEKIPCQRKIDRYARLMR